MLQIISRKGPIAPQCATLRNYSTLGGTKRLLEVLGYFRYDHFLVCFCPRLSRNRSIFN
jgi:hypothetical protein